MNTLAPDKTKASKTSGSGIARLGPAHGYRFDGDVVLLNAMFGVLDSVAHQRDWALQLWACPATPRSAAEIEGHLVAEVALPPIGEIADDTECFEVRSHAIKPAGSSEWVLVLALVSGSSGTGTFDTVEDFAAYPRNERFLEPRMAGTVGYRLENGRAKLEVERIENPRDAANCSGTLALELWASPAPYRGGQFRGTPLAGVAFDGLAGQRASGPAAFDLPFSRPPTGSWRLVLMLREWTALGYVTRDFTNFDNLLVIPAPTAPSASPSAGGHGDRNPEPGKPAPAPGASPRPGGAKAKAASSTSLVSVNSATRDELAAVKGLPAKVAEAIVKGRPFRSIDDLVKVRGMGTKLLARVRSKLSL